MTPTEVAAFLRNYNVWRRGNLDDQPMPDPREIGEAIDAAVAMIDRLEAAEKELAEIRHGAAVANDTIKALRTKITEMEKQEPAGEVVHNGESAGLYDILEQGALLYALPGAQGEGNE